MKGDGEEVGRGLENCLECNENVKKRKKKKTFFMN